MSEQNTNSTESVEVNFDSDLSVANALEGLLPDMGEQEEIEAQSDEQSEVESEESEEAESEENEEQEEESQEPPAQTIKVKVDGEEVEVTLDELKSGYSRTKDYTKKTQEVAQARKALESEYQQVFAERQQYGQLLNQLAQQIQTNVQEPDWDLLRNTDPIEYSVQWTEFQRNQQKAQAIQAEQQRLAQMQQIDQQRNMAATLERERGALLTVVPEWSNPEVAKAEKAMVIEQGKKLGFSDDELAQAFDHRAIVALRKAALYDKLMSKRAEVKPVASTQKTVTPGGKAQANPDAAKRAQQKFKQTGNVRDAASAIQFLL